MEVTVVLRVVLLIVVAIIVAVAFAVVMIFLRQGVQLLRFRWSMRKLADNDAEDKDPALVVPKQKGTLEEEQARIDAIWKLFYRPGLSIAKLNAADRLRAHAYFVRQKWIYWQEWRGWQKLATQGSAAARKKSLAYARREAEKQLDQLSFGDLDPWLALYDEQDKPEKKLHWAKANVRTFRRRTALGILDELGRRDDEVGARALYELFMHYADVETRTKAIEYAKRHLEHPKAHLEPSVKTNLRRIFTPDVDQPVEHGDRWSVSASRDAKLVVRVHALKTRAPESDWLDNPGVILARAERGECLWEHDLPAPSFLSGSTRRFRLPNLEGPLQIEIAAQFAEPALWANCMGKEAIPVHKVHHRLNNTSMDAVLSLTENSLGAWAVDKRTQKPLPNLALTFMRRDVNGKVDSQSVSTDDDGLFSWKGKPAWQFGILVERRNAQGRSEQIFLTNDKDISTSKASSPVRRFYVLLARPLYRPGEVVRGKLIARQKGSEGSSTKLGNSLVFQLEIHTPRQAKLTSVSCTLSEFGTAAFEFTLPKDAPLGKYSFRVAHAFVALEGQFHVEEFVAPEFKAELRTKDKPAWGKSSTLEFEARYFFGAPVANASGTLEITRTNWQYRKFHPSSYSKWFRQTKRVASLPFRTDAQGLAKIDVSWRGAWSLLRPLDGCDFSYVATVRDASGKSCQATLHVSVPRTAVIVSAKPVRNLRVPGETLPLRLSWEPADPADETPRKMSVTCKNGSSRKTFVHEVRRSESEFALPIELPPGRWEMTAHVEGQPSRARETHAFTLLGSQLEQKSREMVVSNDPSDNQGTIRVALMGPKTFASKELLVWNRGSRLGTKVIERSSPTTWLELPYMAGKEDKIHLQWWHFDTRKKELEREFGLAEVEPLVFPDEPPVKLELAFAGATARPGAETSLEAKLDAPQDKPSELAVTVVDEAIFSIVAPPKNPRQFFEESPPKPESFAAWGVVSANAQRGRSAYARHDNFDGFLPLQTLAGAVPQGEMLAARSMAMPVAAPMMPAAAAPKSASPLRAAAAIAAAPVALVGAGAELAADAMRRRRSAADEAALPEQQEAGGGGAEVPVQLRSDFSSEAAWIPAARFTRNTSLTLPIKLPDSLTTWKASALLISLGHDHLLEAEARIRTQKPLMIRLQAPRFFQERDQLTLRALVDSRHDKLLAVQTKLEVRGFDFVGQTRLDVEASGQGRFDADLTVPVCSSAEVVVRGQALATNVDEASDAEERAVPYRPYGASLRKTISGMIEESRTSVSFVLPKERLEASTKLSVQLDRGPLDAVLQALIYLREYPYGCVEQTCSRLLPHLVWEDISRRDDAETNSSRQAHKFPAGVVQETLERILAMQNGDGGFGWWPGGKSDLWMTAYVVFTFAMADQPVTPQMEHAREYLGQHLLERDHSDDADAFAAFARCWVGGSVTDRVLEVLVSRWEGLSLSEKAKLCWVLSVRGHAQADAYADEVKSELVGPAKRYLKKAAGDADARELQWFHPGSTEAIAFFVLGLMRDRDAEASTSLRRDKRMTCDDADLAVLVAFLLQHRQGSRWHNTRDTALAVLALLAYEDALRTLGSGQTVDVHINDAKKGSAKLERLGTDPITMQFRDQDLRTGTNELAFVLSDMPAKAPVFHRHFSAEIEWYTQESNMAATGEGLDVERTYWLLDEKKQPKKQLHSGDQIDVGQFVRVVLKAKAAKRRNYLLLEDFKVAGCEPVAKKSGRDVCRGHCAHVELRADRTAIFFDVLGTEWHEVSYEIEAILPGRFTAMPARIETMYESQCFATSTSFGLVVT